MKNKATKIILLILVLALVLACVAACDSANAIKIKVMDGETELTTFEITAGTSLTEESAKAKMVKADYEFAGLYTDAEFTEEFKFDSVLDAETTLYAKFTQKTYQIKVYQGAGESKVEKQTVHKGEAYQVPAPTKAGYTFVGYVYEDENDVRQSFDQNGTYSFSWDTTLYAVWEEDAYTVTFKDAAETVLDTQSGIKYGAKAAAITTAGYEINGYYLDKDFTEAQKVTLSEMGITGDVTIYVKRTAKTYTLTVDGWHEATIEVTYGQAYALPKAEGETNAALLALIAEKIGADKEWTSFAGYTYGGKDFAATGTYTYAENITVTPKNVVENESYDKATVTFKNGVTNVVIGTPVIVTKGTLFPNASIPEAPANDGYTFSGWSVAVAGMAINGNVTVVAQYNANVYTITIKDEDGSVLDTIEVTYGEDYELTEPAKYGYTFNYFDYNEAQFALIGTYEIADDIEIIATWTPDETATANFVKKDNYFLERESAEDPYTYVFLTGVEYTFTGYDLTLSTDDSSTNMSEKMTVNVPGDYKLTYIPKEGGVERTVDAKVVYDVNSIVYGSDYNAMRINATNGDLFKTTVAKEDNRMAVGAANFIPEVTVSKAGDLSKLTLEQANVVLLKDGEAMAESDYTISGDAITFTNEGLLGTEFTLSLQPKYADDVVSTLKIALNNGVNVYTNAELQAAYANLNVSKINVLRNITASFADDSYISGRGTAETYSLTLAGSNIPLTLSVEDNGAIKNLYGNGVYRRTTNKAATLDNHDSITINGNYFTIDGTKLPYMDQEKSTKTSGNAYSLSEPQVGIFLYRSATVIGDNRKRDVICEYVDGTLTMNNLRIQGNYKTEYVSAVGPDPDQDLDHLKMSASLLGVVIRGGTANLNNTTITNVSQGMMLDGGVDGFGPGDRDETTYNVYRATKASIDEGQRIAVKLNLTNSMIKNCWGDDIYTFRFVDMNIKNTTLGYCCGAAILMEDRPYAGKTADNDQNTDGYSELVSKLVLDNATAASIDNWVVGTEPWFVAYGRGPQATLIKTNVEGLVAGNSHNTMTILKHVEGEAADVKAMNFSILMICGDAKVAKDMGGAANWESDNDKHANLDLSIAQNYLVVDPDMFATYMSMTGANSMYLVLQMIPNA